MLVKVQGLVQGLCPSSCHGAELLDWMFMNEAGLQGSAGPVQD